jgi:uncharacterized protein (DUF1697 family)
MLHLVAADDLTTVVEQDTAGACRTLIQSGDVICHSYASIQNNFQFDHKRFDLVWG